MANDEDCPSAAFSFTFCDVRLLVETQLLDRTWGTLVSPRAHFYFKSFQQGATLYKFGVQINLATTTNPLRSSYSVTQRAPSMFENFIMPGRRQ